MDVHASQSKKGILADYCKFTNTTLTDLVEISVECCIVSIVELRLFIKDVGKMLVSVSF